jgi:predicted nucleotidyltransferase
MDRSTVLDILRAHKPVLMQRFGVVRLSLFGSVSRDNASAGSDVDILVGFDGPATSDRYFGLLFYLEDLLGGAIDLVTEKALRAELRPFVEKEALDV